MSTKNTKTLTEGQRAYEAKRAAKAGMSLEKWLHGKQRDQEAEARAGERIIGYLYNFRHNGRVYAYQSGFADADPRERPGVVAHALAIRHALGSGLRVYDFMAGRNRLKESFATSCEPMLWQVVQQPRLAFRFEHLARQLKQRIARSPGCSPRPFTMKSLAGGTASR